MNYILDINIVLDCYSEQRREKHKKSVKVFEILKQSQNAFLASSSIDNIAFVKKSELKKSGLDGSVAKNITKNIIKELLTFFKVAKTPSYMNIDYDDIEDSQVIASAIATKAKVITRDKKMLQKYPDVAMTPKDFLKSKENETMSIDFANLNKQYFMYQEKIEKQIDKVLNKSNYIMGEEILELEEELQKFTKAKYAITCSSGTDALLLAFMALDLKAGDEAITTPFTFIATAETMALLGIKPVFVDIDEKTYNIDANKIEEKITSKTKAIVPVSLYGQPADMTKIQQIANKHNLKVIVDGAQSFGATFDGEMDSNLGDISCTSFFPAKPLGCFGDGGAVFTNDENLAIKMKQLRVHGQNKRYQHKYIGLGARMDTLQAAIVLVKLKHYERDLKLRQDVAKKYMEALHVRDIVLPYVDKKATSAWAQFSIRVKSRDEVQKRLKEKGIPTAVHYPMPLHLQECFRYLGHKHGDFPVSEVIAREIMSLPMNPYINNDAIGHISESL